MDENAEKIPVRILKHTGPYVPGDIAGFIPEIANKLIASGMAAAGRVVDGEFVVERVAPAAARSEINDTVIKTAVPTGGGETTNTDVDSGTVKTNASSQKSPLVAKAVAEVTGEPVQPEATSAAEIPNEGQGEENDLADADGEDGTGAGAPDKVDAASVDIPDDWEHRSAAERKHIASLIAGEEITTVADAAPIIRAEVKRREAQA